MPPQSPAVEADHLTKYYGLTLGLKDLSLAVGLGEVRGLLGQNGSGKSTLLKSLIGQIRPSSGAVRVLGHDVQKQPLDDLTVEEVWPLVADLIAQASKPITSSIAFEER